MALSYGRLPLTQVRGDMTGEYGSGTTAFDGYVEALIGVIGCADRTEPLRDCCMGQMMPVSRKSVEFAMVA